EIIVHHIVVALLSPIDAVALPVVDDVVSEVHELVRAIGGGGRSTEAGIPTVVVGDQVVVEGSLCPSPDPAVAMFPLFVHGQVKGLGDDAPLHGEIPVPIKGSYLIGGPAHGTVVQDDPGNATATQGIPL